MKALDTFQLRERPIDGSGAIWTRANLRDATSAFCGRENSIAIF